MTVPFDLSIQEIHDCFICDDYDKFISPDDTIYKNDLYVEITNHKNKKKILYYFNTKFIEFIYNNRYFRADLRSLNVGNLYFSKIEKSFHINDSISFNKNKFNNEVLATYHGNQCSLSVKHKKNQKLFCFNLPSSQYLYVEENDGCEFIGRQYIIRIKSNSLSIVQKSSKRVILEVKYNFDDICVLSLFDENVIFNMQVQLESNELKLYFECLNDIKLAFDSTEDLLYEPMRKLKNLIRENYEG